MPYELQYKKIDKREDGQKYSTILITDVMLHTSKHRPTNPGKAIKAAIEADTPGRIYSPLKKPEGDQKKLIVEILKADPTFLEFVREQEALGRKVLVELPKEGVPVFIGPDTQSFITSVKGKRVLRWIDKKNKEE